MSSQEQTAYTVVSAAGYLGTNILAWASSFDAGAIATSFTVLSLAGIAAYSNWVKARGRQKAEETRLEADHIREVEKAKAEAWAERVRLEMQVQQDRERIEAGSLNGQIKALTAKIEEGNKRIEDANRKLHDAADERQTEVLQHHEEVQMLMKQVSDLREENRRLMTKLEAKVQANTGAIDRIVSPDAGTQS
jgi:phage host-nuclease inhibitor protein Gam